MTYQEAQRYHDIAVARIIELSVGCSLDEHAKAVEEMCAVWEAWEEMVRAGAPTRQRWTFSNKVNNDPPF